MLIVYVTIALAIIVNTIFQCASDRKSPQRRASQRSNRRSRKSNASTKSTQSSRRSGSRATRRRRPKPSRSKSTKSSSRKSASNKSKSKRLNPSERKIQAMLLADKKAASKAVVRRADAQNPSSESAELNITTYANIRVIPHEVAFKPFGGLKQIRIRNATKETSAFLVKCSDNLLYSVNPVFGNVEPNTDTVVNVLRENGGPKSDKLVVVTTKNAPGRSAIQAFEELQMNNSLDYNVNVIPLVVE
ncbi:unnamed protein product [Caenorhabditis bovis]|uniref:Major sperm protein n=1 Tax=Caenorhabditis bovis TaxID=2654633 RepID=A0A8S1F392_9PELO|nr:unnamed protein product [Caenorhabditis bovis]